MLTRYIFYITLTNVKNNKIGDKMVDGYWNDIWIITYRNIEKNYNINTCKCENCGATMKYNKNMEFFECNYCNTILYNFQGMNLEIVDIEVKE